MEYEEDDQVPERPPMTLTPIDVDVDGLTDFRAFLIRELDTNLKPAADSICSDHGMGAHFGVGNAGTQVQAARKRYAEALEASTKNLATYVSTAEIMIEAIQKVATNYADADLSVAVQSDKVGQELFLALKAGVQERNHAVQLLINQETQRELNRMRAGTGQ
jgi:hypothetical protein